MFIKEQKFLILGVSKSGYSVAKYLLENQGSCYLYEQLKSPKIDSAMKELTELGAKKVRADEVDNILKEVDVLVISPGIPINHDLAVKAKKLGKRIVGELEFGYLQFNPTMVAVTGTNGKTTTVTLIDEILKGSKIKSVLVGNVGIPLTSKISDVDKDTVCVAEVSSFQLESINAFCPHVTCVLNIAPDHLERHYSMDNYIYLKKRLLRNQRESEYSILNFDDEVVKNFAIGAKSKIIWVSIKNKIDGAYCYNGKIYFKDEYILDSSDLALDGEHNLYNSLFALSVAKLLGVKSDAIVKVLKEFKGVKHRIELIAEKHGVKFYNDSKATNTTSTISAINCMKAPTILILGGYEKGENYFDLFNQVKERGIKEIILTGASRFNMLEVAGKVGLNNITVVATFENAIKIANLLAKPGDSVLLSPACSSYDCFSGYEERGEVFMKTVRDL